MPNVFSDLDDYIALPRVTGLRPAPDGTWLAASVQALAADRKKFVTSIWRIDAAGGPARRLTWSAEGEASPRFLPDGSLAFISRRPDPAKPGEDATLALWLLPPGGGEARLVAALPGGISAVETGASGGIVVASAVLDAVRSAAKPGAAKPGDAEATTAQATIAEADARLRAEREKAGVSAVLHESGPVRFWDSDLGPEDTRLFAVSAAGDARPRDLTPDVAHSFIEHTFTVSPDGTRAVTNWYRWAGQDWRSDLVLIDVATGKATVVASDPDADYDGPAFAPDGRSLAAVRSAHSGTAGPGDRTLVLIGLSGDNGTGEDLLPGFDRWPAGATWSADARAVYFTADEDGRRPVFRVTLSAGEEAAGEVARVTADDGHYGELSLSPDGTALYALRDAVGEPPTPVRIDLATGSFERLPAPGQAPELPGRVQEVVTTAGDGQRIRGWLVLPDGASPAAPAPLVLFVHGGPNSSWNSWQWRWNSWLMAARGYAVLLPDPALSTGYGLDFIRRGYHLWGARAFDDLMAITDAAAARDDIDEARTAMMGGSYGGYMANWIAGHTDRFKAIVSHASLWAMDQMMATTDVPMEFYAQFSGPGMLDRNTPHAHVAKITTPMLVIHGDKDYRVPVGEALRLWWDLQLHGKTAKFLYFPDEGHWILKPGNIKAWYSTVFAFLAEHVLGEEWKRPDLL